MGKERSGGGRPPRLRTAGVFVFIGLSPNTGIVDDLVELDGRGFIATDGTPQTSVPGIFAAGEGAAVALAIRRYVEPLAGGMPVVREE